MMRARKGLGTKYIWILIVTIGLFTGAVIGWEFQSNFFSARGQSDVGCEWNPVGKGSWLDVKSLADLVRRADLVVKAEVIGHKGEDDTFPIGTQSFQFPYLVNELEVLQVLKGEVPEPRISATAVDVCLRAGDTYILFLREPSEGYSTSFVDDPDKRQDLAVYYIVHPFGQWRVRDGRIEHLPDWFPAEPLPKQYHGMPEAAFVEQVRQAMQDTSGS